MKNVITPLLFGGMMLTAILFLSCSGNTLENAGSDGDCFVQLFDGNNYTDDNITVKGPGEFADLKSLPGSDKNWDDEADSFKSGKNTTVIFYTEPNFGGDSTTYKNGAQEPSIDEPRSMKIICNK